MRKLYELVGDLQFLDTLPEDDDETTRARHEEMLNTVKLQIEEKILNIGEYVISLKAESSMIKQEEDRLHARRSAINNRIEWLKKYLFTELRKAMIMNVKGEKLSVYIKSNPPSVEVTDLDAIPAEYSRMIIEPDKVKILELFKQTGAIVEGVRIITDRESITIR